MERQSIDGPNFSLNQFLFGGVIEKRSPKEGLRIEGLKVMKLVVDDGVTISLYTKSM